MRHKRVSTVASIDSTHTREFPKLRLHHCRAIARFSLIIIRRRCIPPRVRVHRFSELPGRPCLSSPVRKGDSPRLTGLRGLDRVNPQLIRDVPQLLDGLQLRLVIVRHVFVPRACLRLRRTAAPRLFRRSPQKCSERAHANAQQVRRFAGARGLPKMPERG